VKDTCLPAWTPKCKLLQLTFWGKLALRALSPFPCGKKTDVLGTRRERYSTDTDFSHRTDGNR